MQTPEGRKVSLFTVGCLRLRHTVAQFMDRFPALYLRLHWGSTSACSADTEIVIDGYPRSGNSFAVRALHEEAMRLYERFVSCAPSSQPSSPWGLLEA